MRTYATRIVVNSDIDRDTGSPFALAIAAIYNRLVRCRRARSTYLGSESIVGCAPLARTAAWSEPQSAPRSRLLSAALRSPRRVLPASHGGTRIHARSAVYAIPYHVTRNENDARQSCAPKQRRWQTDGSRPVAYVATIRNGRPLGNDVRLARPFAEFARALGTRHSLPRSDQRQRKRERERREKGAAIEFL